MEKNNDPMYISYSSSEAYAAHTGISMLSLMENNQDSADIHFFVLDLGMSDDSKQKIKQICDRYKRSVEFRPVADDVIRRLLGDKIPEHYGSLATYARLCGAELYPASVHRIMFVDSDMIIRGSLASVYHADLGDRIVAGVPSRGKFGAGSLINEEDNRIGTAHRFYINCGFLVVDLDNWKKANFSGTIHRVVDKLTLFTFRDQTILNAALCDEYLYRLPCKYNYPMHANPTYLIGKWKHSCPQLSPEEIVEASKDPVIIHYVGEQSRPWYKENISSMAKEYYKYKELSPFRDVPLLSIFDTPKYQKLSFPQKTFLRILFLLYQNPLGYPLYRINRRRIEKQKKEGNKQ